MPGLVDSHVHLATPPNRRQAEAVLRRNLYGGVTAVRDMADDLRPVSDLTRASLVGEIAAPDIVYAALMAGPDFFTDPRTQQTRPAAWRAACPGCRPSTSHRPAAGRRRAPARRRRHQAVCRPDAPLAARITAEAHRQHLLVWAHATLYPAKPSEVVAAGVDAISHACLLIREQLAQAAHRRAAPGAGSGPFRTGQRRSSRPVRHDGGARRLLDATVWA